MRQGDVLFLRIESVNQATIDIATVSGTNLTKTIQEQFSISSSGLWFRVSLPDKIVLVVKSTGLGTAYSITYQYIPASSGESPPIAQETPALSPIVYILMGGGCMLGIILLLALVIWLLCKCLRKPKVQAVTPLPLTSVSPLKLK